MKQFLRKNWPIAVIVFLEGILIGANYTRGTWLVGWDNMMPELDFALNFKRTLFSVWQEYRGLGLLDGMSHAANLVHYSFMWLLSLAFPTHMLRYIYVFSTHLIGGIGMYILLTSLHTLSPDTHTKFKIPKTTALIGALFYQYSFATIQTYYLPFEVFITHFAFLPWLIFGALRLIQQVNKKNILLFSLLSFLSTPQAHVPTVFIVYAGILGILLLWNLFQTRFKTLKSAIVIIVLTIATNALWGFPFTYGALTRSTTITVSKNNQAATEDTYQKNHAFGDFTNTALMRSFSLTYRQFDHTKQQVTFMMQPWLDVISTPLVTIGQWSIFVGVLIGILASAVRKQKLMYPFVLLFVLVFSIIGNDIPLLRIIPESLRSHIPFFSDIFRFVFTKFFVLYAFLSSIFLAIGSTWIISLFRNHLIKKAFPILIITIILFVSYPSFTGNFLHKNLRVQIPDEYFETFKFFHSKDPNSRILILPAPWFWAWTQYRWGVIGSGFTWFGIPQPTIDRAFDPWSRENENLYWELSQIIYTGDAIHFKQFLEKYGISYILLDDYIMHAVNDKALSTDTILSMINEIPSITNEKNIGRISIFHIGDYTSSSRIQITHALPNVGPSYTWNDRDQAFFDLSNYRTEENKSFDDIYPFRSLFTGRSQEERTFAVTELADQLVVTNTQSQSFSFEKDIVYDSTSSDLVPQQFKRCDTKTSGSAQTFAALDNVLTISAINANECIDIFIPSLSQRYGYLLRIDAQNADGKPIMLSITNKDSKRTFLETELPGKTNAITSSYFVIPPMDYYGLGYSINLAVISYSNSPSINKLSRIVLYQIPYDDMVNYRIGQIPNTPALSSPPTSVEHPNPSYYKVTVQRAPIEQTLMLSQAFDQGWKAYVSSFDPHVLIWQEKLFELFPFLFGKELNDHILVNNWENGWTIPSNQTDTTIVIFFLPQILEYLGFMLLPIPFLVLLLKK